MTNPILVPVENIYKCGPNELSFWVYDLYHEVELLSYFIDLFPDKQSVNIRVDQLEQKGQVKIIILTCIDHTTYDIVKFTLMLENKQKSEVAYAC